jgi:hypothetical protein
VTEEDDVFDRSLDERGVSVSAGQIKRKLKQEGQSIKRRWIARDEL